MAWTSPADLRAQVLKLWDRGTLLAELVALHANPGPVVEPPATRFPLRLTLSTPSSTDLANRFADVRNWVAALRQSAVYYRIQEREVRHREVGSQTVPDVVWLDTLEAAMALVGKTKEARQFQDLLATIGTQQPALLPWLAKRPLVALALAHAWPRLLAVVGWLQAHPRPGIYLRQVDVPGVDSKFIEDHKGVLAELFDLVLPIEAVDTRTNVFARRYGFTGKPLRIRFRLLDSCGGCRSVGSDITITQAAFEQLSLPMARVFVTENEINFLAFPQMQGSIVVFGAGYGFEVLAGATWLHQCSVYYWGDIDTHGFAILDQLRASVPRAQSLLMDHATLMAHANHWGTEPAPALRELPRLTVDERAVLGVLRTQHQGVRLEQERIGFDWVQRALAALPAPE